MQQHPVKMIDSMILCPGPYPLCTQEEFSILPGQAHRETVKLNDTEAFVVIANLWIEPMPAKSETKLLYG